MAAFNSFASIVITCIQVSDVRGHDCVFMLLLTLTKQKKERSLKKHKQLTPASLLVVFVLEDNRVMHETSIAVSYQTELTIRGSLHPLPFLVSNK